MTIKEKMNKSIKRSAILFVLTFSILVSCTTISPKVDNENQFNAMSNIENYEYISSDIFDITQMEGKREYTYYENGQFVRLYDREAGVVCWVLLTTTALEPKNSYPIGLGCVPVEQTHLFK